MALVKPAMVGLSAWPGGARGTSASTSRPVWSIVDTKSSLRRLPDCRLASTAGVAVQRWRWGRIRRGGPPPVSFPLRSTRLFDQSRSDLFIARRDPRGAPPAQHHLPTASPPVQPSLSTSALVPRKHAPPDARDPTLAGLARAPACPWEGPDARIFVLPCRC